MILDWKRELGDCRAWEFFLLLAIRHVEPTTYLEVA